MAYQLWDGFDHYNAANEVWSSNSGTVLYSAANARFAALPGMLSQGILLQTSAAKRFNLNGNQPTMCFSLAAKFNAPGGGTPAWMAFWNISTAQCYMGVNASGALVLFSAAGAVLATSNTGVITFGVYHWLAFQITINSVTGSIVAYVDGVQVINASNLNNRNTPNNYMDAFSLADVNGNMNQPSFDDFHAHDTTGAVPNSLLLPDSRIYTKPDSGQGYSTLWTPSGAGTNWQCVDDAIPDGDATYVSSATPGQIDGYALPKVGFVVSPNGLVRRSLVRKDDVGAHTFQNGIRSGNTNALGTAFAVPSAYGWTDNGACYVNDPATGVPFTAAAADAVQNIISMTS